MARRRIVRNLAEIDSLQKAAYLSKDDMALGIRFLDSIHRTYEFITETPGIGSPFESVRKRLGQLRIQPIFGFPHHLIFFLERDDEVVIVRVLHSSQNLDVELREADVRS